MELQSGESQFPAVGSKLRFEGSDEDQKQIICKLRSSVFVLEIISFFLLLLLLGWLWLVRCLWLWVTPTTPKPAKCFCVVTSESASPGFQKWGDPSRSHQCTQYNQYSALLSSPFQIFSIAAAMCRVVPPPPPGIFHSWFKCSALSCFESINQSRCLVKEALRQGSWCFCSWKLFFIYLFINTSVVTWCARLMPSCAHQGVPLKPSDEVCV